MRIDRCVFDDNENALVWTLSLFLSVKTVSCRLTAIDHLLQTEHVVNSEEILDEGGLSWLVLADEMCNTIHLTSDPKGNS